MPRLGPLGVASRETGLSRGASRRRICRLVGAHLGTVGIGVRIGDIQAADGAGEYSACYSVCSRNEQRLNSLSNVFVISYFDGSYRNIPYK